MLEKPTQTGTEGSSGGGRGWGHRAEGTSMLGGIEMLLVRYV